MLTWWLSLFAMVLASSSEVQTRPGQPNRSPDKLSVPNCVRSVSRGIPSESMSMAIGVALSAGFVRPQRKAIVALVSTELKRSTDPELRYSWVVNALRRVSHQWGATSHLRKFPDIMDDYVSLFEAIRKWCKKYRFSKTDVAYLQTMILKLTEAFPVVIPIIKTYRTVLGNWGYQRTLGSLFVPKQKMEQKMFETRLIMVTQSMIFKGEPYISEAASYILSDNEVSATQFLSLCETLLERMKSRWNAKRSPEAQKAAYEIFSHMQRRSRRYRLESERLLRLKTKIMQFAESNFERHTLRDETGSWPKDYALDTHELVNHHRWGRWR